MRLTLQRRRQNRRLALTEEADVINIDIQAPARQGRRAAVMPTDQLLMSQRTSLASQTGSTDGTETEDGDHSASSSRRAVDMAADVQKFLATLETNIDKSGKKDDDDDDDDDTDEDDNNDADDDVPDGAKAAAEQKNGFEAMITRQRVRVGPRYTGHDSDSSHYSD